MKLSNQKLINDDENKIVRQLCGCLFSNRCKLNLPTVTEDFKMNEIHNYWFLAIAIVLAITIGRLGTILREQIEKAHDNKVRMQKLKTNKLS